MLWAFLIAIFSLAKAIDNNKDFSPDPLDDGPAMGLKYYIWGSTISDIFTQGGDGHLRDCDGMGGPFWLPPTQTFPNSWMQVVQGEEFIKEFSY